LELPIEDLDIVDLRERISQTINQKRFIDGFSTLRNVDANNHLRSFEKATHKRRGGNYSPQIFNTK